jgi:hypothetical protein
MRTSSCLSILPLLAVLASCATASAEPPRPDQQTPEQRIYGVTVDEVTNLNQIVASLAHLPGRPMVRIPFDPGMEPAGYAQAVDEIGRVAGIMAQPVDSSEVAGYTAAQYIARFDRYLNAFGDKIAIWEIGNEVNGNWLGPLDVVRQDIEGAYTAVRRAGGRTALTLSYEPACGDDMFAWSARNVRPAIRDGLDYVLISYYAEDCNGTQPSTAQWTAVFRRLHALFPRAKLGFGEIGTNQGDPVADKLATLRRYYRLRIDVPGYIGGYFWWYYAEDMVPYQRNALWAGLASIITSGGASPRPARRSPPACGVCPRASPGPGQSVSSVPPPAVTRAAAAASAARPPTGRRHRAVPVPSAW